MTFPVDWTPERKLFRAVTEPTNLIAWATDEHGLCFYLSPEWYRFTGMKVGEGVGFNWLTAIHPEDVGKVRKEFFHANDSRTALGSAYRLVDQSGKYHLVWDVGLPKFNDRGKFEGFFGTAYPIDVYQEREKLMDSPVLPERKHVLSERERDVLKLIAEGNTSDTVAAMLDITTRTVEKHVAHASEKLGATNRVHAVVKAIRFNEI